MPKAKPKPSAQDQLRKMRELQLEVASEGARYRVQRGRCVAFFETGTEGLCAAGAPGLMIGNEVAHLLDGGYQKFLQTPSRRLPATASALKELHDFQEALDAGLGVQTLYNNALGTTSVYYHYDRVKGRPNP